MHSPAELIQNYSKLKAERAIYERVWQQVADYIRPIRADFNVERQTGSPRNTTLFDSTGPIAADNFAGGIFGMMTNPSNRWFSLRLEDESMDDDDEVKRWLYEVETRILNSFGPQVSRFYSVLPSLYADLACFGTAVFYSEEIPGTNRINDNVRGLSECVISEDSFGDVNTVYRRFSLTGKQAVEKFGQALSDKTTKAAEKEPFGLIWFIHCVYDNEAYAGPTLDKTKRPFLSQYVEQETKHLVATGGYYEMPYHVPRWSQAAGEVYGRGLGEMVLPDVKMVNRQQETLLQAAQKIANPPLGAPDEGVIKAARTWPGGITYGAIDDQGRQLVKPLFTGGDTGITLQMIQQTQLAIKDGFYFSLMQMVGSPNMTATEFMGRQEEKLRLLGPNLGRIQGEFLSPLIVRRFGLLQRAGQLPEAPAEIQNSPLRVEYVSPLAKMQRSGEAQAVIRYLGVLGQVAQLDPSVVDTTDLDEAMRAVGDGYAVPPKIERGKDAIKELRDQRQQAQQMQQGLAAAEQGGKAAKSIAGAGKDYAQAQQATSGESGAAPIDIGKAVMALRGALKGRG